MGTTRAQRYCFDVTAPPAAAAGDDALAAWVLREGREIERQGGRRIRGTAAIHVKVAPCGRPLTEVAAMVQRLLRINGIANSEMIVDARISTDLAVPPGRLAVKAWRTAPPHQRISGSTRKRVAVAMQARWAAHRGRKVGAATGANLA